MAALGMIEVFGFATSIVVADAVAKAADVEVVAIDRNKPANADKCEVPLVMVVKFEGTPAAVQAAHDAGREAWAVHHIQDQFGAFPRCGVVRSPDRDRTR